MSRDREEEPTADHRESADQGDNQEAPEDGEPAESTPLEYSDEELAEVLEGTDTAVLRRTLRETRPTLDTIESFLGDIDDKAGRTLRLNTILIGLLLTGFSFSASQNVEAINDFLNLPLYLGLLMSGISITAALLTFTRSEITPGLSDDNIAQILDMEMSEKQLLLSLVLSHGDWIRENGQVNERDAQTLFASHLFLFSSMGYYAFAVGWVFVQPMPQWVVMIGSFVLLPILWFVIYLPQTIFWPKLAPIWNGWTRIVEKIKK